MSARACGKPSGTGDVGDGQLTAGVGEGERGGRLRVSHQTADVVAVGDQATGQPPADEAGGAGDEDAPRAHVISPASAPTRDGGRSSRASERRKALHSSTWMRSWVCA